MKDKCVSCGFYLRKDGKRKKLLQNEHDVQTYQIAEMKPLMFGDVLCNKCRMIPYRTSKRLT